MIGGGDGFIFEEHVTEPDVSGNAFQDALCFRVRRIVAIDKPHRTAMHHLGNLVASEFLDPRLQMTHEDFDNLSELDAAMADGSRFVDER